MGPAPTLATYQQQAQSVYAPQQAAETATVNASHQANLNTLANEKAQIDPAYALQESALQTQVQGEVATINQTYSEHLLGNFSGLQGNDMGAMFSKANQQENTIAAQRTAALATNATQVANENLNYNATISAIPSKYQSLEAQYADSGYASAVKDYNTQQYQQEELAMKQEAMQNTAAYDQAKINESYAKMDQSAQNATNAAQAKYMSEFKVTPKVGEYKYTGNNGSLQTNKYTYGNNYTGPNGQSLNLGQWASATQGGDPGGTLAAIKAELAGSGSAADQHALTYINYLEGSKKLGAAQVLQSLSYVGNHNASGKNAWDWAANFTGTNL